jgi:hypothetical protein
MMDAEDIQQAILNEATQLSTLLRPYVSRAVSRSGSSASDTDSSNSSSSKPRRAETFSGFERDKGKVLFLLAPIINKAESAREI